MSILGFHMIPGGICVNEAVDAEEVAEALDELEQIVPDELSDNPDPVVQPVEEPAPAPEEAITPVHVKAALNQYDGTWCFSKLIEKLGPCYEKVQELRNLRLDTDDPDEMLAIISQIQDATECITGSVMGMIHKQDALMKWRSSYDAMRPIIRPALGMLKMNRSKITLEGMDQISFEYSAFNPHIRSLFSSAADVITRSDMVRGKYELTPDAICKNSSCYHKDDIGIFDGMSIHDVIGRLLDPNQFTKLLHEDRIEYNLSELIDSVCHDGYPHEVGKERDNPWHMLSKHIRWVMTESYAIICEIASGDIDPAVFTNMCMRLCGTVCNLFYLSVLRLFSQAEQISMYMASKNAAIDYLKTVRNSLVSTNA